MAIACDLCVIGAGSAGLSVAAAAAQFGQRVVLIEKGEMGGDCLNFGCVPSKAMIAAARHAHCAASGDAFGMAAAAPKVDFAAVQDHVQAVIASIAPHDSQERFEGLGVQVIRAPARFTDAATVVAGGEEIKARRFVIATGSTPAVPPIPGLDTVDYLTNETVFANRTAPDRLIVIGAGPIGLELAQAHRRLGCNVVVLEAMAPLANEDPDLVAVVLEALARDGVEVLAQAKVDAGGARRRRHRGHVHPRGQERDAVGQPSARRHRPHADGDRARTGGRRHRLHETRDHRRCGPAHQQPQGLRHRRRDGRPAVHPRGLLPGRAGDPERAVRAAGAGLRRPYPARHLH
jgi:pyruvate/2-oxoglutarate dehydrogenase complex dihydrolipoamide dehydrogenase (E3) component